MKKTILVLFAAAAMAAFAEKQPFERYQTIIDRMPFGQPPPGFDPTRNPDDVSKDEYAATEQELTQEQAEIQKAVHFSVINVDPDGTVRIGFSDKSDAQAPKHYYMAVGETRDSWTVKAADPVEKSMTVAKDGVEVQLKLGDNSGGDSKGQKGSARGRGAAPNARGAGGRNTMLARGAGPDGGAAPMSFRGRRERREAEEAAERAARAEQEAERKRLAEEAEARQEEEKAAREAERAEQREQLKAIQEELRRAREEKDRNREEEEEEQDDGSEI